MKRQNINRNLAILAIVGVLMFSFIPFVAAGEGSGKVTKRPIDDWLDAQWGTFPFDLDNWGMSDFVSPYSNLVAKMGFPFPGVLYDENKLVSGETTFGGHITERALKDGRALITVHLNVWNAPLTVFYFPELWDYLMGVGPRPLAILGAYGDGYIDYKMVFKFFINEPGDDLPFCWDAFNSYISLNIIGTGYGTLTAHAADFGFTPGATGMLKLHQLVLIKPDLKEDHPKYYPGELWPVETVEIHEL